MKTMFQRGRVALILAAFGLLIVAGPVAAEERTCRGIIGAATVDNLRVPQGATCVLEGTIVKGTIKVERDAVLRALGVRVVGNVQGENAQKVVVADGSRVGGSVQVKQGARAKVVDSRVNGDIQFDDNSGKNIARRNVVGGSVQAFQNDGGVAIFGNRIDGNLQCKENSPRPTGGGNVVGGNEEDQCRGF